ncbi:glycine oxidase [Paenibacillus shirakamiensis]|uniref:glycine oxidase n=1 Tax=Paenibacillus shirakamiensis TaxID=1265935 RepID=A0ABS4JDK9_9BACL|nr:glycine oxidase ThiO [Paenibacillus shirakamiensis]MBP1999807.1 glycine oxidase [Paenibacillus shirakamiensis]
MNIASSDVIIVGGGVIGCFLGYLLSKRGKQVLIIEQSSRLASGASGAAAGMLAADSEHFGHPELMNLATLSRNSFAQLARELRELSNVDIEFNGQGFITPIRDQEEAYDLLQHFPLKGNDTWWTSTKLAEMEPFLNSGLHGAIFRREETQIIPQKLTQALGYSAQKQGAELCLNTKVMSLYLEGGHVKGVHTSRGTFEAGQVVLASGWQLCELLEQQGLNLPLIPVKGEIVEVRTERPLLHHTLYSESVYMVPKSTNRLWLGATSMPGDRSPGVRAMGIRHLIESAEYWLPAVGQSTFERAWCGHRPKSPDGLPYIGEWAGIEGLYVAAGHYRNGVLLSSITATILANILEGIHNPDLNLKPFRPDRFQYHYEGAL